MTAQNERTPIVPPADSQSASGESKPSEEEPLTLTGVTLSPDYWTNVFTAFVDLYPILLGNVLEWYDFGVYGYLADEITENFFEEEWVTWLFFAISFFMRPFGGMLCGVVGDRIGRKQATYYAIFGMTIATVAQGCLPSKKTGGEWGEKSGVVLLFVCRVVQGLCTGGEIAGVCTYMAESAQRESLGTTVSWIVASSNGAYAIAAGLVIILTALLGSESMEDWGWRIPFWLASIPAYFALTRLDTIPETSEFVEFAEFVESVKDQEEIATRSERSSPCSIEEITMDQYIKDLRFVLKHYKKEIFLVTITVAGISALWYVGPIYGVSYATDHDGSRMAATAAASVGQWIVVFFALPVGWLVDKYGLGKINLLGNLLVGIMGIPMFAWLYSSADDIIVIWVVLGLIMGFLQTFLGATIYLVVSEMFPTNVRYTATGLGYNLAVGIFGGVGPLYCTAFKSIDLFPGYYLAGCGFLSTGGMLYMRHLRNTGQMNVTHLRSHPY